MKINHLWPVRVRVKKDVLELRMHPMKQSYRKLPANVKSDGKSLDDAIIKRFMLKGVPSAQEDKRVDFNRGIKWALEADHLDMPSVSISNTDAQEVLTMKGDQLVKQGRPDQYKNVILKQPIERSLFKSVSEEGLPPAFNADPTRGELGFTMQQAKENAVEKLLDLIYLHN